MLIGHICRGYHIRWFYKLQPSVEQEARFSKYLIFTELVLGCLSNDDVDGNENGKKAIGLDWQNSNLARASRFFVHFLAVAARLQRDSA